MASREQSAASAKPALGAQRAGIDQWLAAYLGGATGYSDRAHPAGQATAKCLRQTLQPDLALRVADPDLIFDSIEQAQDAATRWLWTYNHEHPSMALGGITPMQKLTPAA